MYADVFFLLGIIIGNVLKRCSDGCVQSTCEQRIIYCHLLLDSKLLRLRG